MGWLSECASDRNNWRGFIYTNGLTNSYLLTYLLYEALRFRSQIRHAIYFIRKEIKTQ